MSLVPMNLSFVDRSSRRRTLAWPFSLPPTPGTVPPPQPPQLSDRPPHRDGLNVADRANDLEVHRVELACRFRPPELSQSPNTLLAGTQSGLLSCCSFGGRPSRGPVVVTTQD